MLSFIIFVLAAQMKWNAFTIRALLIQFQTTLVVEPQFAVAPDFSSLQGR